VQESRVAAGALGEQREAARVVELREHAVHVEDDEIERGRQLQPDAKSALTNSPASKSARSSALSPRPT
jgi:hypothetical protein